MIEQNLHTVKMDLAINPTFWDLSIMDKVKNVLLA